MKVMYFDVVDCEHEGDVFEAEMTLIGCGAERIKRRDYEYDDEGEIVGCQIVFECANDAEHELKRIGAYT